MFVRLLLGLAMGLLMYRPRDITPYTPGTPSGPPDLPPGVDGDPEAPLDLWPIETGPEQELPPTGPPGYEGEWPPSGTQDAPPTGPPGFEGTWPPKTDATPTLREQLRDALRTIRLLERNQRIELAPAIVPPDAHDGAARIQLD